MQILILLLLLFLVPILDLYLLKKIGCNVKNKWIYIIVTSCVTFLVLRFTNVVGFIESIPALNESLAHNIFQLIFTVIIVNAIQIIIAKWYVQDCSVGDKKQPLKMSKVVMVIFIMSCALGIFATINYVTNSFGQSTTNQIIFAMISPLEGTSSEQILLVLLNPVLTVVLLMVIFILIINQNREIKYHNKIILNPLTWLKTWRIISIILLLTSILGFSQTFGVGKFIYNQMHHSSFIQDNYVSPNDVNITLNGDKQNLIHIYMESGEVSFADKDHGGGMDENVIPDLYELTQEGISFTNKEQRSLIGGANCIDGSTWTIAGITNTETGVPLKVTNLNPNYYGKGGVLIPGALGLGNILEAAGYNNYLMIGSDKEFAGRAAFYDVHGNYQIDDLNTAKQAGLIPQNYEVNWGYEDTKLFSFAQEKLNNITTNDKPFNFTLLTTATHAPEGYYDSSLPQVYDDKYLTATYYSNEDITNFVRWCQAQPWYENTTIVITGDHISMNSATMGQMDHNYTRTLYNVFLNSKATCADSIMVNRNYLTLDYFPTILASLGFEVEGNRLGLGTNLFSGQPTLCEQLGLSQVEQQLSYYSTFYNDVLLNPNNIVVYNRERLKINGNNR